MSVACFCSSAYICVCICVYIYILLGGRLRQMLLMLMLLRHGVRMLKTIPSALTFTGSLDIVLAA